MKIIIIGMILNSAFIEYLTIIKNILFTDIRTFLFKKMICSLIQPIIRTFCIIVHIIFIFLF